MSGLIGRIATAIYTDHPRYGPIDDRTARMRELSERRRSVCSSGTWRAAFAVTPIHGGPYFRLPRCGYGTNQTYLTQPFELESIAPQRYSNFRKEAPEIRTCVGQDVFRDPQWRGGPPSDQRRTRPPRGRARGRVRASRPAPGHRSHHATRWSRRSTAARPWTRSVLPARPGLAGCG